MTGLSGPPRNPPPIPAKMRGRPAGNPAPDTFAALPSPPYYVAIFSSVRTDADAAGYGEAAARMIELARGQPGFLGVESARGEDGFGITASYWESEEAIRAWRRHAEHAAIRERGRAGWYRHFELRIARVERAYGWDAGDGPGRTDASA